METRRTFPALAIAVMLIVSTSGSAQGDPPLPSPRSLETASYPLFAVDDSGVTGQFQVVERAEGGTHLVLTVHGIAEGAPHTAAVYLGSCGPDRPVLLALEPIGRANDPFVSITESTLSFAEFTRDELFVYVFAGEAIDRPEAEGLDAPALACGQVGLGALEGRP